MADNVLVFEFLAKDHFSPTSDKVSRKLDTMGERLGSVGKTAAFALGKVGVAGIAAFGFEMVKGIGAATAYQTLQLKTAAVIKSTGNVAHLSVAGIDKLAASLESISGVDETLIINSENVLATFTNIRNSTGKNNDIYNQATARILDLSVAMGEDLQTATVQVGKALNDPIKGMTALQRVGVTFNATQKEQIKHLVSTGNLMGAQKIILAELGKEFGGAAKAAGSGFGGALARLQDALEDTFRDMAAKLLPVLTVAANWLAERLPGAIQATGRAFSVLGGWLALVGKNFALPALRFLVTNLRTLAVQLLVVGKTIGPPVLLFFKSFGNIVGGVLTTGVRILVHYFRDLLLPALRDAGAKVFPAIREAIGSVVAAFKDHQDVIRDFGKVFMFILKVLGVALAGLALLLVKVVIPTIAELIVIVMKAVGPIVRALLLITGTLFHVITGIASFAVNAAQVIARVVTAIVSPFITAGRWLFGAGQAVIAGLVKGITLAFVVVTKVVSSVVNVITAPFRTAGSWLMNAGKAVIGGLTSGAVAVWPHLVIAMRHTIDLILGPYKAAGGWLLHAGVALLQGLIGGAQSAWHSVTSWITDKINAIRNYFAPAVRWLVGPGVAILRGLVNGMVSFYGVVTRGIRDFITTRIWAPFSRAIGWLLGRGRDIISGLWRGISSLGDWLRRGITNVIKSKIWAPFAAAGHWLIETGYNLIGGLWTGISKAIAGARAWISAHLVTPIINAVRWFFGISSPSKVMAGIGGHMISGLIQGLLKHNPVAMVTKIFGGMPSALGAIVQKGLLSIASLPGKALAALGTLGADVQSALGMSGAGQVRIQGGGNSANRQLGQKMAAFYGWGTGNQWASLNNLWMGESGWNNFARNPSSGAFGIPQALPPGKMGSAAAHGDAAAQIRWGLSYIRSRYGSPANAYSQWLARSPHWYDEGGILKGKGLFGKNTSADERVLNPRQTKWFERAMALGARSGGGHGHAGVTLILNAPNYVGSRDDLLDEFNRFARQGRLDAIVRMAGR